MITGKNYIGNNLSANGAIKFKTLNPLLNIDNSWECIEATGQEIDAAAELASRAFKIYRNTSSVERAEFLEQIVNELEDLKPLILETYCSESGLPIGRAENEFGRTLFQLQSFASLLRSNHWLETSIDPAIADRKPLPKPDLRKTYIPLGPIAVFGSSNFPLAYSTAGGDTASALAMGCPVVVKSHPMHAGTGEIVASAIVNAAVKKGLPNGVFSNLNSFGIEVGIQLVKNPRIKGVGFTGSIKAGRALYDIANQRSEPIPVFAEMGSVNPVVISKNALKEKGKEWGQALANSVTLGTGQFCTNPGLIIALDSPWLDAFAVYLAEKIVEIESSCMLHPNIKNAYTSLKNQLASQPGVSVLTRELSVSGNFAEQTVVVVDGSTFIANPKLHQEVFGPFSVIVKCANEAQLMEIIENLEGQLTGTIIAEPNEISSLRSIMDALQQRVGRLIFNGVPTGVEVSRSMNHGGPYPASTDSRFSAVGADAIKRWIRPISYQDFPNELLPNELKNG